MHHIFLFDLDQTLLDFHASEKKGLQIVVEAEGFRFSDDLYSYFKARNKELWLELEKGTISRTELFETRFRLLFEKCGADTMTMDLLRINDDFIRAMARNGVPMDGSLAFLKKLRDTIPDAKIYIVTNGVQMNAEGRIRSTGMDALIDGLFVSTTIGANKPSVEYFDIVLKMIGEEIGGAEAKYIVIGDSLTSDMRGAKDAGLPSCWFVPEESGACGTLTKGVEQMAGDAKPEEITRAMAQYVIDYIATSFDEMYEILREWADAD